jgi:TPR repeat protein
VGVPANLQEAMRWYRKAAENGDKRAQRRLLTPNDRGQMSALDRRLEMEAMKDEHLGARQDKSGDGCRIM